jgi:hypothetical protein
MHPGNLRCSFFNDGSAFLAVAEESARQMSDKSCSRDIKGRTLGW